MVRRLTGASLVALLVTAPALAADSDVEFFESRIRPLLVEHCYACHGAAKQKGDLRLDSRSATRRGGDSGPAVVPGKPDDSPLIRAVRYASDDLKMPPKRQLPPTQIADLEAWVRRGAVDPRDEPPGAAPSADWDVTLAERRSWWSLRPVRRPEVPPLTAEAPSHPVDRFLAVRRAAEGLRPAGPAEPAVLVRRLHFLLTGLPASPGTVLDPGPDGYERLVDRLLASPHFGERWARHWMDVVRYGDTYGYEWDIPARGAWRYRDYLVRAFNADVPFDQLVREQLAGDLLPEPRIDAFEGLNESLTGTMFYQLGEKRHGDSAMFNGIHQEMLHNKIDAFGKAFQGLTIGCAQCHDHKLDAVGQRDYYALAGVFMSARWLTHTLDTPERQRVALDRLRALKAELRPAIAAWWMSALEAKFARTSAADLLDAAAKGDLALEHPLHPWQALSRAARAGEDVAVAWRKLADTYARTGAERAAANARDFTPMAEFREGVPAGWSAAGVGLRDGPVRPGDFTVALDGPRVVGRVLPGGLFTDTLSPRLNGAVRTPFVRTVGRRHLSLLVAGGDFSTERVVVDNAFLAERQAYLKSDEPAWRRVSAFPEAKERRIYIELATKGSNPNFPPRVGLGGPCSEAEVADPRSWFGVVRAVAHDVAGAPADELTLFRALFASEGPRDRTTLASRHRDWFRTAVAAWGRGEATDDQARLLNTLLRLGILPNGADSSPAPPTMTGVVAAYRTAERAVQEPATANGMADLDPAEDYRLNVRGDYDRPSAPVPRGYLGVFAEHFAAPRPASASGRRALAEFVASPANPLTARVYVNRVWQAVFGVGLVRTPDDFGRLGEAPSHPELLDYLASWFVEDGWSTKRLVRLLVTSSAFRRSNRADPEALRRDPDNRLVHHFALRRLEAETLRDALLATSGRLDPRLYGPSVNPYRVHEDAQKRLFSGPLDGDGRRSLYTKVTIMEPPSFLAAFNQPAPKIPTGRRDVSNGPAQALALLNDPLVTGQAEYWAARLVQEPHRDVEERLQAMFQRALGRVATAVELRRWSELVVEVATARGVSGREVLRSTETWREAVHALFNTKEFVYLR